MRLFNQPARRKPGIQPKEQPMNRNAEFLASITQQAKTAIIDSIACHYGITSDEAMDEVTDDEAENLLEYMVEPQRSAASVLMQKHGFTVK